MFQLFPQIPLMMALSAAIPKKEIGKLAVRMLLDQVNGTNSKFPLKIVVTAELIERESVKRIK